MADYGAVPVLRGGGVMNETDIFKLMVKQQMDLNTKVNSYLEQK